MDFGCGYGYLALKLLSVLPEGSTYLGIDSSEILIAKAREIFCEKPMVQFMQADLLTYEPEKHYDLAICQCVLRHIPNYKRALEKMKESVKPGGKVVCMENNRRMEQSGLYVEDMQDKIETADSFYKDHWYAELASGGRDYLAASKIPFVMQEIGLQNVKIRVNDYAEMLSKNCDNNYEEHYDKFLQEHQIIRQCGKNDINALFVRSMLICYGEVI